jgi:hypothetical protein
MDRNKQAFGRKIRYAITPIETVRALNVRTDEEVIEAQKQFNTEDMISALEEMVNAARAGRLEGKAVLALGAAAW